MTACKNLKDKYLIKFNYKKTKGWQCRIHNKSSCKEDGYTKFFSIKEYKTFKAAKVAATVYRDDFIKEKGIEYKMEKNNYRDQKECKRNSRNSSGVLGVTLANWKGTLFWKAYANIAKVRNQGYCIGDDSMAFIEACKLRYKWKGELIILDESKMPCTKQELFNAIK